MLNDRQRHAKEIGFLKGSLTNKLLVDLTGNRYQGNAIHEGIGNTSYQIGGAGA